MKNNGIWQGLFWQILQRIIRLLTVMRFPCTFRELHIRKDGAEARFLRTARIYSEADPAAAFVHMADAHLRKMNAVL